MALGAWAEACPNELADAADCPKALMGWLDAGLPNGLAAVEGVGPEIEFIAGCDG